MSSDSATMLATQQSIKAYVDKRYDGSLLDLMDTMEWLAANVTLLNHDIPADFFDTIISCQKVCSSCAYCKNLFNRFECLCNLFIASKIYPSVCQVVR